MLERFLTTNIGFLFQFDLNESNLDYYRFFTSNLYESKPYNIIGIKFEDNNTDIELDNITTYLKNTPITYKQNIEEIREELFEEFIPEIYFKNSIIESKNDWYQSLNLSEGFFGLN
jgi:hypothetical protein